MTETNYSMLCDFYELTMSNGYFKNGFYKKTVYFDLFFRKVPDNGGFAIAAGLEQVIDYIKNLHFSETDIEYLREKGIFDEEFLKYLSNFKFTGDIYAIPEGTPIFPNEPIITVKAPAIEAQLIETFYFLQSIIRLSLQQRQTELFVPHRAERFLSLVLAVHRAQQVPLTVQEPHT